MMQRVADLVPLDRVSKSFKRIFRFYPFHANLVRVDTIEDVTRAALDSGSQRTEPSREIRGPIKLK
jgi:hypothetical protein